MPLSTSDVQMCLWTTCAPCASHFTHPAHHISLLQRMLFRAECLSLQAYASCAHLHPHKRLRNVLSGASVVISREMTSVRAWRWRVTELGDDERQSWEMTEVTRRRWRVRGCGGYEQAWAEMTKGAMRRWRVWGSSGHEQAWAEMTKESLVRWCRVMRKVYEWDPVGCMGEVPLGVWVRHQHLYGWDTSTAVG